MKKSIYLLSVVLILTSVLFTNCKKDSNTLSLPGSGIMGEEKSLETLSGFVVDENDLPMQNVTVSINGNTYTTGTDGFFIFYDLTVQNSRYVLNFKADGYFTILRSGQVVDGQPVRLKVQLLPYDPATNAACDTAMFLSSNGGTVTIGNLLTLNFPANNFMYESGMPYNGTVHVKAMYVDPTLDEYNYRVHGGDQLGIDFNYQKIMLRAFVGGNVMLFDDLGQKLQLNPNMKANVDFTVEIPAGLTGTAPSTIETWTFDENTGLRVASAGSPGNTAGKTGNKYQGALGHFSYFSCEISYINLATVKGQVLNTNGDPVSGVYVNVGQSFAITDQNGEYEREVIAGMPITVGILPDYFGSIIPTWTGAPYNTQVVNFQVPAEGLITGQLVDCNGQPVAGHINLAWSGGYAQTYTTNGFFEIEIPATVMMIDYAYFYGNNTDAHQEFVAIGTFPYDFGIISLCPPPPIGVNKLIFNGGSIPMTGEMLSTFTTHDGHFYLGSGETYIEIYGPMGGVYLWIDGIATGTFPLYSGSPSAAYYDMDTFDVDPGMGGTGTVTISRFDPVGGLIEGTLNLTASDGTAITGQFSVPRTADQP